MQTNVVHAVIDLGMRRSERIAFERTSRDSYTTHIRPHSNKARSVRRRKEAFIVLSHFLTRLRRFATSYFAGVLSSAAGEVSESPVVAVVTSSSSARPIPWTSVAWLSGVRSVNSRSVGRSRRDLSPKNSKK